MKTRWPERIIWATSILALFIILGVILFGCSAGAPSSTTTDGKTSVVLYEVDKMMSDGSTVTCLVGNGGALSCDWGSR